MPGPTRMPAARKPTTIESPILWHSQPTAPATTRITARSWMNRIPCMAAPPFENRSRRAARVNPNRAYFPR